MIISGYFVNIAEESKRQNELFLEEQKRQREAVGRIEKIEIQYEGPPGDQTIVVNKNISTPYDCAKRKPIYTSLNILLYNLYSF